MMISLLPTTYAGISVYLYIDLNKISVFYGFLAYILQKIGAKTARKHVFTHKNCV